MTFTRRRLLAAAGVTAIAAVGVTAFVVADREPLLAQDVVEGVAQAGLMPDHVIGKPDAAVTIIEYASMTCPACAAFHAQTLPQLKTTYLDQGKARYILREFPLDALAAAGAMLARCAAGDDKRLGTSEPTPTEAASRYHAMVNVLFAQQRGWAAAQNGEEALLRIARQAGFSQETFYECLKNDALLKAVNDQGNRGQTTFGVRSTPTLFINGRRLPTGTRPNFEEISKIIEAELRS